MRALDPDGAPSTRSGRRHTIVATGGAGQCFAVTTNPTLSTGDGIALALRAGVAVADVEFMQFHPTALHHPSMPRPLLSEALRGEGAVLRDEHGVAFMADEHPLADLAPRDVVARAIARRLVDRGLDHLWLDATTIDDFPSAVPDDLAPRARPSASTRAATGCRSRPPRTTCRGGVVHRPRRRDDAPGPVGVRRGRVQRRARRQPARVELAARRLVFGARVVEAIVAGKDGARGDRACMRGLAPWSAGSPDRGDVLARRTAAPHHARSCSGSMTRERRASLRDAAAGLDAARRRRSTADCDAADAASVAQPAASVGRALARVRRSPARSRAARTPALDFPETVGRASSAGSCPAATRRRRSCRCPPTVREPSA